MLSLPCDGDDGGLYYNRKGIMVYLAKAWPFVIAEPAFLPLEIEG